MDQVLKIKLYSSLDCPYCYVVKDYLTQKKLEFEEVDLYENPEKREEMEKISGQKNLPVLVINEEVIVGWNKEKIDEVLKKYGAI